MTERLKARHGDVNRAHGQITSSNLPNTKSQRKGVHHLVDGIVEVGIGEDDCKVLGVEGKAEAHLVGGLE